MPTRVIQVNSDAPEPALIAEAADILRAGGLVAFPTETVYGLGANALDAAAVARVFAAKGRPAKNPLIVHVAELELAVNLVPHWPEAAAQLSKRFWPGPLTLVLERKPSIPDIVTAGGPTVALRMPAHRVALALLRAAQIPVAAPSANRSTYLSPTRAEHVLSGLDSRIDLLLDAGSTPGGIESTVLDLTTSPPRLLRPGLIALADLEVAVGKIDQSPVAETLRSPPLKSPGMLQRHYAPRAKLDGVEKEAMARALEHARNGLSTSLLTFGPSATAPNPFLTIVAMPTEPGRYAAQLYAALHECDRAGANRIVVALPPDRPEWLAVRDRLKKASTAPDSN
ncbi:MAG: L-threonylcarbamoyladenylate synthase [Gemmataceae bacterium]